MKLKLIILFLFMTYLAFGQFPNRPGKIVLGYQTTATGLIATGGGNPSFTPSSASDAYFYQDTTNNKVFIFDSGQGWKELETSIDTSVFATVRYVDSLVNAATDLDSLVSFISNIEGQKAVFTLTLQSGWVLKDSINIPVFDDSAIQADLESQGFRITVLESTPDLVYDGDSSDTNELQNWSNLPGIPADFADNVDNDTQLSESQVDDFVANNGYLTAETDPIYAADSAVIQDSIAALRADISSSGGSSPWDEVLGGIEYTGGTVRTTGDVFFENVPLDNSETQIAAIDELTGQIKYVEIDEIPKSINNVAFGNMGYWTNNTWESVSAFTLRNNGANIVSNSGPADVATFDIRNFNPNSAGLNSIGRATGIGAGSQGNGIPVYTANLLADVTVIQPTFFFSSRLKEFGNSANTRYNIDTGAGRGFKWEYSTDNDGTEAQTHYDGGQFSLNVANNTLGNVKTRFHFSTYDEANGGFQEVAVLDNDGFVLLGSLYLNSAKTLGIFHGTGTPEGNITADVGSTFHRTDGGAGTSYYVKESGSGNTGWIAK